jgi:hypothetical protein
MHAKKEGFVSLGNVPLLETTAEVVEVKYGIY